MGVLASWQSIYCVATKQQKMSWPAAQQQVKERLSRLGFNYGSVVKYSGGNLLEVTAHSVEAGFAFSARGTDQLTGHVRGKLMSLGLGQWEWLSHSYPHPLARRHIFKGTSPPHPTFTSGENWLQLFSTQTYLRKVQPLLIFLLPFRAYLGASEWLVWQQTTADVKVTTVN